MKEFEEKETIKRNEESKEKTARQNYELFYGLPQGSSTIEQVRTSSAGIEGWGSAKLRSEAQGEEEVEEEGMSHCGPGMGMNVPARAEAKA